MRCKMRFFVLSILCFCFSIAFGELTAIKVDETLITDNASQWRDSRYGNLYLNSCSFQQDALITFNGWQYAVFYSTDRYITVARRKVSSKVWESCELTDYKQSVNDNHNTISMGISPADGRLHLSFDHHTSTLHYRMSIAGLLSNPDKFQWSKGLFTSVNSILDGESVTSVTYPRFITAPDSTLVLTTRIGTSGDSDNRIWKYNNNGTWRNLGQFIEGDYNGGNCTAYFHGLQFDNNNRLHAAWCWRETGSGEMNHDLMYATSDDYGLTWHDMEGAVVARAGSSFISQNTRSCRVWTIPTGTGLINQEGMAVDKQGRVHVLSRENVSGKNVQMHYFKDTTGPWHRINTNIPTKVWDNRSSIAFDGEGNVYAIMPHISIAGASVESGYSDWRILTSEDDGNFYYSEPLISITEIDNKSSRLYVFAQKGFSTLQKWKNVSNVNIGPEVMNAGKNAYCQSSSGNWTDFKFTFSLKISEIAAGVCFRVQDSTNLYMWQFNADSDLLRFHVRKQGTWTVLKETTWNIDINTEYRVGIVADGGVFKCMINDQKADSVSDASIAAGGIGFRSGRTESFIVDDVHVSAVPSNALLFSDDFTTRASLTSPEISCLEYTLNGEPVSQKWNINLKNMETAHPLMKAGLSTLNNRLTIFCELSERSDLSLSFFNPLGVLLKKITVNNMQKGTNSVVVGDKIQVPGICFVHIRATGVSGKREESLLKFTGPARMHKSGNTRSGL